MQQKRVVIIGSGFSGLSASCFLAKAGEKVTVIEKHDQPGGRARTLQAEGFTFDMGPSWYWMPDVFERFFGCFGKKVSDYYQLERLDPSYRIFWPDGLLDVPANYSELKTVFDDLEKGSGLRLDQYLKGAKYKYETGINNLVYKPGRSLTEFIDLDLIKGLLKLQVFTSAKDHIKNYFNHPKIQQLLEFPLLFLGALPENTPALYSLMNYADIKLGTWYPKGGMGSVVKAMYELACSLGVEFEFNQNAEKIIVEGGKATAVKTDKTTFNADVVLGSADYHFIEANLLEPENRSYSYDYWNNRVMAPSCLIYYLGLNKKVKGLLHHTLFFDTPFQKHADEINKDPSWPTDPMFYVSCTSKSDESVCPDGHENVFILIPVAPGLKDNKAIREHYYNVVIQRIEDRIGQSILPHVVYKKTYAHSDFVNDYNAFKGNAYGLANTLEQTAILKPALKSKKVKNLFYTGQLTVPGPGVPPSIISGEVVSTEIMKYRKIENKKLLKTMSGSYE